MSRKRLLLEWLVILACTLALAWWALADGLTARFDNALLDRLASANARPAADEVLIVAIDDRSLAEAGRWPWDRAQVAKLLDRLSAAKPRAVLLDVLYTEPSTPQSDSALAQAMARAGNVALPYGLAPAEGRAEGFDPVPPIPELIAQAKATGHVAVTPDADGTVRRLALRFTDSAGSTRLHLVRELYRAIHGAAAMAEPDGDFAPVLHLRPAGSYRTVSASALLRGEVPGQFVTNKIVIVGATASGLGDLFPVADAAGSMMSGAELQANLYQDIGEAGFIAPVPQSWAAAFSAGLIVLLFIGFWRLRPSLGLALAIGLAVIAAMTSIALTTLAQLWLPPGPSLLALIAAYPLWGWRRLVAVSHFLDSEAAKLEPGANTKDAKALGGFDRIARQVSRLDYLVDEVAARRDFLRKVIESTPDALFVFDAADRLLLMNTHAATLIGEGMEGLGLRDLLSRARGRINAEGNELDLSDGRIFAISQSDRVPPATLQSLRIAVLTDITATRHAEEERRHMLEFLSHDMRAPQVAILGLAGKSATGDDQAGRFARIRANARRTMELADNFVQLARLAEVPLALEEHDLGMIAEEARDRAWNNARDRGISLSVSLPDDPLFVRCDGQVMSRVLDNLIGNAVRYVHQSATVCISVQCSSGGNARFRQAILVISDDGPGLPEGRRDEPFRRYGPRGAGGTGLGLAFVSEAVARHGGTITCSSEAGKGTEFTIILPALDDPVQE